MSESLHFLTQFTTETLTISSFLLMFIGSLIITFWVYNRRKFHRLTHQIPASVVKNYLDSIIQNSNALKSSLFRGGGLDLADGPASVVPLSSLPSSGIQSMGGSEELNQKNAEIASLHAKLAERSKIIQDLEKKLSEGGSKKGGASSEELEIVKGELTKSQKKIEELQAKLAETQKAKPAAAAAGGSDEVQKQLEQVTKERDELKERLQEYEIIEEDLANLKRLQQENEMLKKSLEAAQGGAPAPAAAAPEASAPAEQPAAAAPAPEAPAEAPAAEAAPAEEAPPAEQAAAEEAAPEAPAPPAAEGEQKSAEELLSEFEKMLG